jgi:hypothetical protein
MQEEQGQQEHFRVEKQPQKDCRGDRDGAGRTRQPVMDHLMLAEQGTVADYRCFTQSELRLLFWAAWSWGFRSSHPVGKLGFYAVRQLQRAKREDVGSRNWWVVGAPGVGGRWRLERWRRRWKQRRWDKKMRGRVLRGMSGARAKSDFTPGASGSSS